MEFLGFSNHEKGAPRQEISKWSTVCSTFSRSEWSVVRSASLSKGGTSKKRPYRTPTKFRFGVIRRVHELFKRPSYDVINGSNNNTENLIYDVTSDITKSPNKIEQNRTTPYKQTSQFGFRPHFAWSSFSQASCATLSCQI
jgi:hypothetical protein